MLFVCIFAALVWALPYSEMEKWIGNDGRITKVAEAIPLVGYIAAFGHWAHKGDHQRARRAAAKCTGSTAAAILTTGGVLIAGPIGGAAGATGGAAIGVAAAGGAVGGLAGGIVQTAAEGGIAKDHIDDAEIRKDCADLNSPADWALNISFGAVAGAAGAAAGAAAAAKIATKQAAKQVAVEVAEGAGKAVVEEVTEEVAKTSAKEAAAAIIERTVVKAVANKAVCLPVDGVKVGCKEVAYKVKNST